MEKELIIKALECCKTPTPIDCRACGYKDQTTPEYLGCCNLLVADALALIKELTEENEKIKSIDISKDIVIESLAEENERLKAEVSVKKKLLDKCVDLEDRVRADTVREFAERLKAICWGEIIVPNTIDRIAKEILEGEME